jgi:hypothetical protein
VLEIPDADHALHVVGDWRLSVRALEQCLESIEEFAADVAGASMPAAASRWTDGNREWPVRVSPP